MLPQFTRPGNPVSFADRDALLRFLSRHNVQYQTWGKGRLDDLWKEIETTDALITVERIPGIDTVAVFRNIRTVTLRITFEQHNETTPHTPAVFLLVEYRVGKRGELIPREHTQSSVTEKLHWNSPGHEEVPMGGIIRVLREELGIQVPYGSLRFDDNLFRVSVGMRLSMTQLIEQSMERKVLDLSARYADEIRDYRMNRNIELDVRWSGRNKYPGIVVRNQLVHYLLKFDPENYKAEGYVEEDGRYRSIWKSCSPPP
jgi:hypothetical protein